MKGKYVTKLNRNELKHLFKKFSKCNMVSDFKVFYDDTNVSLKGITRTYDELTNEWLTTTEYYEMTDYEVYMMDYPYNKNHEYRSFMYRRFGKQYAVDYLFHDDKED